MQKRLLQNTPRHILIKLTKIKHKEQILKAEREKQQITHKGIPIRITAIIIIKKLFVHSLVNLKFIILSYPIYFYSQKT